MLDLASSTADSALRGLVVAAGLDPLVVVVDGDRERLLGLVLADDVAVQELVDLARLGQLVEAELAGLGELLLDDLVAQVDALVADVDAGPGDQLLDLLLALSAERALEQVTGLADTWPRATRSSRCTASITSVGAVASHRAQAAAEPERYPQIAAEVRCE